MGINHKVTYGARLGLVMYRLRGWRIRMAILLINMTMRDNLLFRTTTTLLTIHELDILHKEHRDEHGNHDAGRSDREI